MHALPNGRVIALKNLYVRKCVSVLCTMRVCQDVLTVSTALGHLLVESRRTRHQTGALIDPVVVVVVAEHE